MKTKSAFAIAAGNNVYKTESSVPQYIHLTTNGRQQQVIYDLSQIRCKAV